MTDLRVITMNLDFAISSAKHNSDIDHAAVNADILMFQEAKNDSLKKLVNTGWTVHQNTSDEAHAGAAMAWRKSRVSKVLGKGLKLGVAHGNVQMLDRYICWADLEIDGTTQISFASAHLPPQRYRQQKYNDYIDNLAPFIKNSRHPALIGADWNWQIDKDPGGLAKRSKVRFMGYGIDGFAVEPGVKTNGVWQEPKRNSDHRAVGVRVKIAEAKTKGKTAAEPTHGSPATDDSPTAAAPPAPSAEKDTGSDWDHSECCGGSYG